jgi:hypothetical protein
MACSNEFSMKDSPDRSGGERPAVSKEERQERLKLALRENLKRRKSQARGRVDRASASCEQDETPVDHTGGEKTP